MSFRITLLSALALVMGFAPAPAAAECELNRPIMFAGLDWDSNAFHTEAAGFIMKEGYGCEVDQIPGSTLPLLTGMARGDIDVTMEIWLDNVTEPWTKAEAAGKVSHLGINFPDAIQGWYVPRYLSEGDASRGIKAMAPDLKHVRDLPKYKDLFKDPEEPDKGRFYNCILGWGCEVVNTKKLKVYGLDKSFTNFRPGTGAALAAAIASNYQRGKPFVSYYWGPTWVLGKFDMVMLDEPPYDKETWVAMGASDNPTKVTSYPIVEVVVGVNNEFKAAAPKLVEFLTKYETSNALVSEALAYMQANEGATAKDAAMHFLKTKPEIWTQWVSADVASKVKAAL